MSKQIPGKQWQLQEAKARFSAFLDACLKGGPRIVTRRGTAAAVLVPIAEWERLNQLQRPSLKQLLLAEEPRFELSAPSRGRLKHRKPIAFD
jgi:prevent-host-death family protein